MLPNTFYQKGWVLVKVQGVVDQVEFMEILSTFGELQYCISEKKNGKLHFYAKYRKPRKSQVAVLALSELAISNCKIEAFCLLWPFHVDSPNVVVVSGLKGVHMKDIIRHFEPFGKIILTVKEKKKAWIGYSQISHAVEAVKYMNGAIINESCRLSAHLGDTQPYDVRYRKISFVCERSLDKLENLILNESNGMNKNYNKSSQIPVHHSMSTTPPICSNGFQCVTPTSSVSTLTPPRTPIAPLSMTSIVPINMSYSPAPTITPAPVTPTSSTISTTSSVGSIASTVSSFTATPTLAMPLSSTPPIIFPKNLGDTIYYLLNPYYPQHVAKITGMILSLGEQEAWRLANLAPRELFERANEAYLYLTSVKYT